MRTSKMLLVIVIIFIVAILTTIPFLIPNIGIVISMLLAMSFIAVYLLAKYIGETTPQILYEGEKYVFIGADFEKGWLFLKKHVHIDAIDTIKLPIINSSDFVFNSVASTYPINIPAEDYDLPGTYKGELFNHGIEPGATVVVIKNTDGRMGIVLAPAA